MQTRSISRDRLTWFGYYFNVSFWNVFLWTRFSYHGNAFCIYSMRYELRQEMETGMMAIGLPDLNGTLTYFTYSKNLCELGLNIKY